MLQTSISIVVILQEARSQIAHARSAGEILKQVGQKDVVYMHINLNKIGTVHVPGEFRANKYP